jgi:hypothetical protein
MGRRIDSGANKYTKKGFIARLPVWFKALFIKFWFAGAVFYFIGWGLSAGSQDQLDLVVVLGLVHGLATDLFVNRILVFIETDDENRRYMIYYSKRFLSVPINILFGLICAFLVAYTYSIVNFFAMRGGLVAEGYIFLGTEPILYGLLYILFEFMFIGMKNMIKSIINKARMQ